MRTLTRFLALLFLVMTTAFTAAAQPPDAGRAPMQDLIIPADELAADIEKGTTIIGGELAPQLASGASFTSGTIEAPIPFNAVVPHWTGDNAEAISLQVRTSPDGQTWGDWVAVHANHDWMEPDEAEIVGEMVLVPAAGTIHHFVQVQVLFGDAPTDEGILAPAPSLSRLRLTFIDTHDGPTADELLDLQSEIDKEAPLLPESLTNYPKPFVVSRAAWCQHADCNYTEGLEYHPVSHLIVHHTVSNNASADWPAVVRAIWNFHTYSRGWGDIGYNYLVDPNGVLYEGHNGGDDVVGTHASGANTGSMALALLGTFTAYSPGIRPPDAMLNAAVELLSWAADRRDINVFDASASLPNIDWGLPHLMGHRDVYGTTECPGDQAHLLIPWLREQIAGRIGLTDPFLYADDQTTAFTRSQSANWFVPPYLCGFNNHAWYTWSVNSPASSTNWGEWRPNVPAAGRYRIDVYAPYCRTGRGETGSATYTIAHAGGTSTRTISHQANIGLWTTLGEFNLNQGNGNVIRLTDLAGDSGLGVWFDVVRLLPLSTPPPPPPPPVPNNLDPAANNWRSNRSVAFAWQIANPETVTVTTLQVAVDPGFGNVLVNQSWLGAPTSHSHTFSQDYADLYWRVLVAWSGGPLISSLPTRFQLDATPPQSAVGAPLYFLPRLGSYVVSWSGEDALAGVDRFHVELRPAGGTWTRWLSDTRLRSANFTPPAAGQVYEFRSLAIDVAGNVEPAADAADATTNGAITLADTLFLPSITR